LSPEEQLSVLVSQVSGIVILDLCDDITANQLLVRWAVGIDLGNEKTRNISASMYAEKLLFKISMELSTVAVAAALSLRHFE